MMKNISVFIVLHFVLETALYFFQEIMKYKLLTIVLATMAFSAFATLPAPSALPKNGSCPSNYIAKGNECEPTKEAKFVVAKSGVCPEDYETDGNYCVATPDARLAIRRAAMSCPKGYMPIGDYCVSEK